MSFYFVRHGQTEANHLRRMAGSGANYPLNETGHRQARTLAESLQKHVPQRIYRVIASDLARAQQTGDYLARQLALPLETHAGLREWNLGEWEGRPYDECLPLMLGDGEPLHGE